jgi:MFS family permease
MNPLPGETGAPSPRFHYGWVIVPMAALVMLATLPGRTQGLGLITEPLMTELQVDRVAFANVNLWATLVGSTFCFPVGWAIDRFGVRFVTVAMLLATGGAAWALSLASGAFWSLLAIVTLTRGFGQSALSVCSITTVGKWFPRRSGPAMGAYALIMSVFFAAAFVAVGWGVREHGWRSAWSAVAMALIFVVTPLALLLLRNPPAAAKESADEPKSGMEFGAALRTATFWVFAGATALFGLVSSGLGLFQQAVLAERGFDQKTYHDILSGTFIFSLAGQFGGGWLMARIGVGRVTAVALLIYAAALGWLPFVTGHAQLWSFAGLMGISGGVIIVVFFAVWSQAFGRAHLGRIQAAAQFVTVIMSAIGPLLFAECQKMYGSYSPILFTLAVTVVIVAGAAWQVRLTGAVGAASLGK